MRNVIYVYMKEPAVRVLGPGKRYVLWVQGCERNCPGCIADNAHDMEAGTPIPIDALALEIALSDAEGLTVSGGEPFLQAEELAEMIRQIRARRPMGVIVYTGNLYEDLVKTPGAQGLLAQTDLLIDGPYIREQDDGKSLRGSANQRVLPLTELYREELAAYGAEGRERELFYHGIHVHEIGIPKHHAQGEENP